VRDSVRGFSTSGAGTNPNSVVYRALGAANLLSSGSTGDLPPGSKVLIMPFDSTGGAAFDGTVTMQISYPFQLTGSPFNGATPSVAIKFSADGSGNPFRFLNFTITQQAVAAQEIYQATN
jgi:hypothetical protein